MSFTNNYIFTSLNSSIFRSVRGKRAKLQMVDATSSPLPPSSSTPLPAATTPLIGCRQVLSALNGAYSTPLARARLPLQPRLLLAVCLTISANKKVGIWLNRFFYVSKNSFIKLCQQLRQCQFRSIFAQNNFQISNFLSAIHAKYSKF